MFQSTLPYRERRKCQEICRRLSEFQSTLPYRERLAGTDENRIFYRFQSTLPYRERPQSRTNHLTIFRDYCTIITICSCQHKPYDTNHTYFLSFSCTNAVRISQRLYERLWFALLLSHLIIWSMIIRITAFYLLPFFPMQTTQGKYPTVTSRHWGIKPKS